MAKTTGDDLKALFSNVSSWTEDENVSTIQFQQVVVAEGVIDLGVGQPNRDSPP